MIRLFGYLTNTRTPINYTSILVLDHLHYNMFSLYHFFFIKNFNSITENRWSDIRNTKSNVLKVKHQINFGLLKNIDNNKERGLSSKSSLLYRKGKKGKNM